MDMTEKKFKEFLRVLRPFDQKRLYKKFDFALKHVDARTMVNLPNKVDAVLISVMLELIGWI